MARTGGRAARWAVAVSAAAVTALLVGAGVTLTDDRPGVLPAALGGAAASSADATTPAPDSRTLTGPPTTAAVRTVPGGAFAPSSSVPSATPSSSGPPPSSAAASPVAPTASATPATADPEYPTWPGATADSPLVSFIGDSWTDGAGATDRIGYAYLTGRRLGWAYRVLGVGGSGYVRGGAGNVPFDERILPAVAGDPDVVVIQGSINEAGTPSPELAAAVADTLTRLVSAAGPDTAVVVLGASQVPGMEARYVDKVNDVVRAEAAREGLLFVDVAAEVWSDPADPSIWADEYHVNDAGAQQIAERLAPVLQAVVAG